MNIYFVVLDVLYGLLIVILSHFLKCFMFFVLDKYGILLHLFHLSKNLRDMLNMHISRYLNNKSSGSKSSAICKLNHLRPQKVTTLKLFAKFLGTSFSTEWTKEEKNNPSKVFALKFNKKHFRTRSRNCPTKVCQLRHLNRRDMGDGQPRNELLTDSSFLTCYHCWRTQFGLLIWECDCLWDFYKPKST